MRNPEPFSVDDVVNAGTLAAALEFLVFEPQPVRELREAAKAARAQADLPHRRIDLGFVDTVIGASAEMIILRSFAPSDSDPLTDDEWDALSKGTVFYRPLLPWEAAETAYWRGVERRARALFSMLISGRIEAYGYNVKDGCENRILPAIWQHHRYFVQPGSGDVFELDPKAGEEGEMVLRWEALTLRKPAMTATAVVTHPTPIAVPTPSRKTCKADAVATAIAAEDLADNNRGLSPKQIAYRIGPRLEEFNFSLEALTKQVSRFYKKNAKAPVSDTRSATS